MNTLSTRMHAPHNALIIMNGTFTHKFIIKKEAVKQNGTAAIYLQVFINRQRKRISLNLFVAPKDFDAKKQRVKGKTQLAKDLNLILENTEAVINSIRINYRLSSRNMTMQDFLEDFNNPTAKTDFITFYEKELSKQLENKQIKPSTHRQQKTTLTKLKKFKSVIPFYELDEDFVTDFTAFLRTKEKNLPITIHTSLKNIKKFVHLANKKRINTPLSYEQIKVKAPKGMRTFLSSPELKKLFEYWNSGFINDNNKATLSKFLFSCFTGLRISDVQKITQENIVGEHLVFVSSKSEKLQRIKLNSYALKFINTSGPLFNDTFEDQTLNDFLKDIARTCGITKKVTFHVARHTFATLFLIQGGKVEVLQKILGHSKIETTMLYVHIVDEFMERQIDNMDFVFKI